MLDFKNVNHSWKDLWPLPLISLRFLDLTPTPHKNTQPLLNKVKYPYLYVMESQLSESFSGACSSRVVQRYGCKWWWWCFSSACSTNNDFVNDPGPSKCSKQVITCIMHLNKSELITFKDTRSWQSLLLAAEVRNYRLIFKVAKTLKGSQLPNWTWISWYMHFISLKMSYWVVVMILMRWGWAR